MWNNLLKDNTKKFKGSWITPSKNSLKVNKGTPGKIIAYEIWTTPNTIHLNCIRQQKRKQDHGSSSDTPVLEVIQRFRLTKWSSVYS